VSQLAPESASKHIGLGTASVGGAAQTYDAATQWAKIYKDGKKKPDDVEMHAQQGEHLLPATQPVGGNTPAGSASHTPAGSPPGSPAPSRPGTPHSA
jgi:hypothetical protein